MSSKPPWKNRDWLAHGGPAPEPGKASEPGNVPFAERSVAVPDYGETYLLGGTSPYIWNVGVTVYPEGLDGEPFHVTIVRVETDESSPPSARTAAARAALLIPREMLGRGCARFAYRGESDAPVPANPFANEPPANPFTEEPPTDWQMQEFMEREMKAAVEATGIAGDPQDAPSCEPVAVAAPECEPFRDADGLWDVEVVVLPHGHDPHGVRIPATVVGIIAPDSYCAVRLAVEAAKRIDLARLSTHETFRWTGEGILTPLD